MGTTRYSNPNPIVHTHPSIARSPKTHTVQDFFPYKSISRDSPPKPKTVAPPAPRRDPIHFDEPKKPPYIWKQTSKYLPSRQYYKMTTQEPPAHIESTRRNHELYAQTWYHVNNRQKTASKRWMLAKINQSEPDKATTTTPIANSNPYPIDR